MKHSSFFFIGLTFFNVIVFCNSLSSLRSKFRYEYPDYCAKTPLARTIRQSPPLDLKDQLRNLTLQHVQLFIRHGARTPLYKTTHLLKGKHIEWNCVNEEGVFGNVDEFSDGTLLFHKSFDAYPNMNTFRGTCQKGQLLDEGVFQHKELGKYIAESYLIQNHSNKLPHPNTPSLISKDSIHKDLYFRTSDMPRTRLSGAYLISSALKEAFGLDALRNDTIQMHTIDLDNEYIYDNPNVCFKIEDWYKNVFTSEGYRETRKKNLSVMKELQSILGNSFLHKTWLDKLLDYLMVSVCTNRWSDLPDKLRPNGSDPIYAQNLFTRIMEAIKNETKFLYTYNDSHYSKLSLFQIILEMREAFNQLILGQITSVPKLVIWSGHDTTLMGLFGILGVHNDPTLWWPPYASIINLEIYKDNDNDGVLLLRVIANGKVITSNSKLCNEDFCDLSSFIQLTNWAPDVANECRNSSNNNFDNIEDSWIPWPSPEHEDKL